MYSVEDYFAIYMCKPFSRRSAYKGVCPGVMGHGTRDLCPGTLTLGVKRKLLSKLKNVENDNLRVEKKLCVMKLNEKNKRFMHGNSERGSRTQRPNIQDMMTNVTVKHNIETLREALNKKNVSWNICKTIYEPVYECSKNTYDNETSVMMALRYKTASTNIENDNLRVRYYTSESYNPVRLMMLLTVILQKIQVIIMMVNLKPCKNYVKF
jgi:hypothetical protein